MNDQKLKESVQEAYNALHRPQGLDERTLERISALRQEHENVVSVHASSLKAGRTKRFVRPIAVKAVAACLALALIGFGGSSIYFTPVAYADVEAQAGVELVVNGFDRVIGVEGLDETGNQVLDGLAAAGVKLKGMGYQEALDCLTSTGAFVSDDNSTIQVTVACGDQDRADRMNKAADECLAGRDHNCARANLEDHLAAHAAGQGMHRYGQTQNDHNQDGKGMHGAGKDGHHE